MVDLELTLEQAEAILFKVELFFIAAVILTVINVVVLIISIRDYKKKEQEHG